MQQKLDSALVPSSSVSDTVYNGPKLYDFEPVTEQLVKEIYPQSSPKTCELDPIPSSLIVNCLDLLLPHKTYFINVSLMSWHFPLEFRQLFFPSLFCTWRKIMLGPFQSAYRKGHDTECALLKVVNNLLLSADGDN